MSNIISNDYQDTPVIIQSQTESLFQYYLINELKTDITLTSIVNVDDEIINVSAGHGFVVGDYLVIRQGDIFEQTQVVDVNVNAITVSIPFSRPHSRIASYIFKNCPPIIPKRYRISSSSRHLIRTSPPLTIFLFSSIIVSSFNFKQ